MRWYRGPRAPYQNGQETEENIEKAFLELIREKYIDDITISDIARKACIERSTFYRHSLSIDDLVTTLAQEMIWEMRDAIQKTGKSAIAAFPYVVWWLSTEFILHQKSWIFCRKRECTYRIVYLFTGNLNS